MDRMTMTFDQIARYLVKDEPGEFLQWVFPRLDPRLRFARWLDSQSTPRPGDPDRRCDTIAELTDTAGTSPPWLAVLELFTRPDPDALDRTIEYLGRFRRELRHGPYNRDRYLFAAAMIFLTDSSAETDLDMTLPGQDDVFFRFGPRVVPMTGRDAIATLTAIRNNQCGRTLLPWIPLMQGGGTPEAITAWKELAEALPDRNRRLNFGAAAGTLAELGGCGAVWRQALEGWNVEEESRWLKELEAKAVAKAKTETKREDLLQVVRLRFPGKESPELLAAVERQTDNNELLRWLKVAVVASDIAQIQSTVLGDKISQAHN